MRPVDKGKPPVDEYARYQDALDEMLLRIGCYCSYCEQPIQHAPEIEHVQPKSIEKALEKRWENFLLGCKSCNSTKGSQQVDLDLVAFPDQDNTFIGLKLSPDGQITVSDVLSNDEAELMKRLVHLVKLHRHPGAAQHEDRPTPRDKRANLRMEVWILAEKCRDSYLKSRDPHTVTELIVSLALAKGFFSVWMNVFCDYPVFLRRFIEEFPGTDIQCFDAHGQPVRRHAGRF